MSQLRNQHMTVNWYDIIDTENITPASEASLKEKATLVGRVGLLMLSAGTGAWRVRASMNKISRALNITCNADIGLLAIAYTCIENGETYTNALSLRTTGVNTHKLSWLEEFADNFAERTDRYSVEQFHRMLDKIENLPANYKAWHLALASACACCAFTYLLGGGYIEMICAFLGAGAGNLIRKLLLERHITLFANVAVGTVSACCVYVLAIKLAELIFGVSAIHQSGYICSMLFVIPGFPLITGGIDISKLDLRSGIERITYALIIIMTATLAGWVTATVFRFAPSDFQTPELNPILTVVCRLAASFCGVFGFSLMFNSTGKMALTAGLIGMIVNTFRLELVELTSINASMGAFIGAFCAGLLASALKKKVGFPRITLTVPSIVIMVPGMYMYKGIYFIALNDIAEGGMWLTKALMIVLALPLGLIAARILTDKNFRKST
ncbi:MAG: threonine/serine exporter family protein [Ruminococcus flavefaciens]|nr:threonine/serine exporter family protein [Ruminococcus flavefaciens]MCM1231393.1 threonine/serine exporter family protein [Ruminococcus flavefaciens]